MKNFFLSCKEIRIESTSPKTYYGAFYLGPFKRGQGLTVANALRRTLLSEIPGLAITAVKIEGASHEYSSLEGIRESILDILLNLKEIVLKKTTNRMHRKPQMGYLQVRGPGPVRASDLKLPPTFECADPDQYVATLSENGRLNLKFKIDEGEALSFFKQPLTSLDQSNPELNDGFLTIDPVFTPIKKVNYTIESYGAESIEKTNEVIVLEIWTNGSLSPKEAICKTLNYLRVLFNQLGEFKILQSILTTYSHKKNEKLSKVFKQIDVKLENVRIASKQKNFFDLRPGKPTIYAKVQTSLEDSYSNETSPKMIEQWECRSINDLGLPFRLANAFANSNITTVGDILKIESKDFLKIPGFGEQSLILLKTILKTKGLSLKD